MKVVVNSVARPSPIDPPLLNVGFLRQILPRREHAVELLLKFQAMLANEVEQIELALARDDLQTVRYYTHRIRSGSLYLGIEGVGWPATRLEELIDDQASTKEVVAAWSRLRDPCEEFLGYSKAYLLSLIDGFGKR